VAADVNATMGTRTDIDAVIYLVGKKAEPIKYCHTCQTHDCVVKEGCGDCWGMSDFLLVELKNRDVCSEILQYATSYASNHRSVKYKDANGNYQRFPYRKFNINMLFRDTDNVAHGSLVKKSC